MCHNGAFECRKSAHYTFGNINERAGNVGKRVERQAFGGIMSIEAAQGATSGTDVGPIDLSRSSVAALHPVSVARLGDGFWLSRSRLNTEVRIPSGAERLVEAGNIHNLELAAGRASGAYRGDLPFLDSDVYKWLEASAWDARHGEDETVQAFANEVIELLGAAQEPDGYLDSNFQVKRPGVRFSDLQWGHELYCAGHLVQAAIARVRARGDDSLLEIALRFVATIERALGESAQAGVGGHPEIEMALVELARLTGDERHLRLAQLFVNRRGHGLLGAGRFGSPYWQDDVPVRETAVARGHAVRQLYLLAGVVDTYLETGEQALLTAAERTWVDLVTSKTYITGGQGARHTDESLGDGWELPADRAYCETCAAVGSIMLNWRLLLATGDARYADLLERTLFNGFLSGASLDGAGYRYVNPLHVRHNRAGVAGDQGPYFSHWFRCACCPPNVMRLVATLEHYVCAGRPDGLALHQYVSGEYGDGPFAIRVETGYPFSGRVAVAIAAAPEEVRTLALRVPQWAERVAVTVNGAPGATRTEGGWLLVARRWRATDHLELDIDLAPRLTRADHRVDAVRGTVAIERGPLVYCVEEEDNPGGVIEDVVSVTAVRDAARAPEGLGELTACEIEVARVERPASESWWTYSPASAATGRPTRATLRAIPYYAWGNRSRGAMRVWLPDDAGAFRGSGNAPERAPDGEARGKAG